MSRDVLPQSSVYGRFPRVSGDEPGARIPTRKILTFSPRERG